jgi:hypothetical protein
MKVIIASILALSVLSAAGAASAHGHHHKVCKRWHHHRVCHW